MNWQRRLQWRPSQPLSRHVPRATHLELIDLETDVVLLHNIPPVRSWYAFRYAFDSPSGASFRPCAAKTKDFLFFSRVEVSTQPAELQAGSVLGGARAIARPGWGQSTAGKKGLGYWWWWNIFILARSVIEEKILCDGGVMRDWFDVVFLLPYPSILFSIHISKTPLSKVS